MLAASRPNADPACALLAEARAHLAADPVRATAIARQVLAQAPGTPDAALVLGCALRLAGDAQAAVAVLEPLAQAQPTDPLVAVEWGQALLASGDAERALAPLDLAARARPGLAVVWQALACALRATGQEAQAWRADAGAVAAASRDPLLVEAARAMAAGAVGRAEALIDRFVAAIPDSAAGVRLAGELAWRKGEGERAIALVARAVALAPGFEAARVFLVRMLVEADRLVEAQDHAEFLVAQAPDEPGLAMLHASVLVKLGRHEDARAIYRLMIDSGNAPLPVWLNLGHVAKTLGRRDEAELAFRGAIALAPTAGEAWWSLANLKTVCLNTSDITAMREALPGATGDDAFHLHFALGKALEDAGDNAAAFAAYAQANRLRRASLPWDAAAAHGRVAAQARLLQHPCMATAEAGGAPDPDPIFIIGLPRAGSTLVEQILSSHSAIEGTHELAAMMMLADRLAHRARARGMTLEDAIAALDPAERHALGRDYLARAAVHRRSAKPHFIDKMPNNWQHLALIRLILPRARIVDVRRHPMACGFSVWKQHFARGQAFSYDLADIGRTYRDYVAFVAAFEAAVPGRVQRVIYEQLVADTEAEVRRLLDALDLPFESACLDFWRNRRPVRTASAEQVRQPINTDAVDHWQRFAAWLDPLAEALGSVRDAWPAAPTDCPRWLAQ